MNVPATQHDVVVLLGVAATAALAVSLGVHPWLAAELAIVATLLLVVAVLLRQRPDPDPPQVADAERDALATARRAVEGALAGPWGVQGRFRRVVRNAVRARLAREGLDVHDVVDELPPELVALLGGRWDRDQGLTAAELDRVLTTVEELDP